MYFCFGIPTGCGVSYNCTIDLLGSSQVVFEAAFGIFSAVLFPTESPAISAVFFDSPF